MIKEITHLNKKISINLHENEIVSSVINNSNSFFEIKFLEFVRNNFQKQKTIIDIGANIGNHSLFFSEFLEYDEIICFEPFEKNVELLKLNLIGKNCRIMDYALSDSESEKILYNSQSNNFGGFSLHSYDGSKGENKSFIVKDKVVTKTLDSLNLTNVTMIKIDVEGHENSVLNGGIETIKKNSPIIFIENLSGGYPHLFNDSQFDEFFKKINYIRTHKNIEGSFMDLWIPKNKQF
jgi:FkbM family methyltransferase